MGKEKKPPLDDAKKGWLKRARERYHSWRQAKKQEIIPEITPEEVLFQVDGRVRPLPEKWSWELSGLNSGVGALISIQCVQFLEKDEHFITTEKLRERAAKLEGFRGGATACSLEAQADKLPEAWRGRRLHFLAQFFISPKDERHILKLEWNGKKWILDLVPLDINIWNMNDYFVVQKV